MSSNKRFVLRLFTGCPRGTYLNVLQCLYYFPVLRRRGHVCALVPRGPMFLRPRVILDCIPCGVNFYCSDFYDITKMNGVGRWRSVGFRGIVNYFCRWTNRVLEFGRTDFTFPQPPPHICPLMRHTPERVT